MKFATHGSSAANLFVTTPASAPSARPIRILVWSGMPRRSPASTCMYGGSDERRCNPAGQQNAARGGVGLRPGCDDSVEPGQPAAELIAAQAVKGPQTVTAPLNHTRAFEHGQVMRDKGRRQSERSSDRAAGQ